MHEPKEAVSMHLVGLHDIKFASFAHLDLQWDSFYTSTNSWNKAVMCHTCICNFDGLDCNSTMFPVHSASLCFAAFAARMPSSNDAHDPMHPLLATVDGVELQGCGLEDGCCNQHYIRL